MELHFDFTGLPEARWKLKTLPPSSQNQTIAGQGLEAELFENFMLNETFVCRGNAKAGSGGGSTRGDRCAKEGRRAIQFKVYI